MDKNHKAAKEPEVDHLGQGVNPAIELEKENMEKAAERGKEKEKAEKAAAK